VTKLNLFQTVPDAFAYNAKTATMPAGIASENDSMGIKSLSIDEMDLSNLSFNKNSAQKNHRYKSTYIIFGGTFLVFLLFFMVALYYLYQPSSQEKRIEKPIHNQKNVAQILKTQPKPNARQLFNTADTLEKSDSPIKALKYRIQGINTYIQASDYQAAFDESQKVEQIFNTQFLDNTDAIIRKLRIYHYNFLSEIYYRLNKPKKSVAYSDKALRQAISYYGDNSLKTAKQYELLAFNLDNIGNFDEALKLRHNAINIRLTYDDSKVDEGKLIADMNNLGEEYRTLGNFEQSKEILLRAIDRTEKKHGIDAPELIVILNNLGLSYQESNNKVIALSYLQQAYQLAHRHYGNDHDLTKAISQNVTHLRGFRL
jgi:tetratricopeptide (TPR) repeat protein